MTIVTLGGVTIGLALAIRQAITWWPGLKALRKDALRHISALAPFLAAWAYGALATLTTAGLIGWAVGTTLAITSWLGDVALVWGVGGVIGQTGAAIAYLPLTQTGSAVVLLLTVGMVAAVKRSRNRSELICGTWCGITLGTSSGVAGFAAVPLAQAANWLGGVVYGAIG
ncbi:hypothetical protein ACWF94_03675 [Streptomyces sp. NPDC055078]